MPFYWERHPDGPFVTLITIAATYLDPENYDLDDLKRLAKRDDLDEVRVFKSELREALRDPDRLPCDELSKSVQYENGSVEAFLVWLWYELYGDEPFEARVLTRLRALPEPFAERLHGQASWDVTKAVRAGEWDKAVRLLLAGLAESKVPVSAAEHEELAALLAAIGQPPAAIAALSVSTHSPAPPQDRRTLSCSTDSRPPDHEPAPAAAAARDLADPRPNR
jgi:hypothetical protein